MLFNEPKLLKFRACVGEIVRSNGFSALQRAEIAEISNDDRVGAGDEGCFSALQRAEIAEIFAASAAALRAVVRVSVLFNEPKLLKSMFRRNPTRGFTCFSALQRAEIAEMVHHPVELGRAAQFQCSSTSRNC